MKLLPTLVMTLILASSALALAPTASADTCAVSDPDVERVVCTPVLVAYCVALSATDYKHLVSNVVDCATVLY